MHAEPAASYYRAFRLKSVTTVHIIHLGARWGYVPENLTWKVPNHVVGADQAFLGIPGPEPPIRVNLRAQRGDLNPAMLVLHSLTRANSAVSLWTCRRSSLEHVTRVTAVSRKGLGSIFKVGRHQLRLPACSIARALLGRKHICRDSESYDKSAIQYQARERASRAFGQPTLLN